MPLSAIVNLIYCPGCNSLPDRSSVFKVNSFNSILRQTLNSVIAQTLLPSEIIICDDCSTDGSQRMIKNYERRYPNLIKES
ncbi:MAG: glycosyltransferase [Chloroflexi bacterium]|nr:glycosyltransferase [Chloroflexota bacterium]